MRQDERDTRAGDSEAPVDPSDALSRMADGETLDDEEPSALDSFYGVEVDLDGGDDDDRVAA